MFSIIKPMLLSPYQSGGGSYLGSNIGRSPIDIVGPLYNVNFGHPQSVQRCPGEQLGIYRSGNHLGDVRANHYGINQFDVPTLSRAVAEALGVDEQQHDDLDTFTPSTSPSPFPPPIQESSPVTMSVLTSIIQPASETIEFPVVKEDTGFVIGGNNSSDIIRGLSSLNGIPIQQLEMKMRPGRDSDVGFLGLNESLLEIMASDNDFILGHGLKHQEIAVLLKKFAQMPNNSRITVHDIGCLVSIVQYRGIQLSPFGDDTLASTDITVTNLTTRRSIEYSALLPEMIGRYGFYEGRGTSYRLDPAEIMEVFPFFSILGR